MKRITFVLTVVIIVPFGTISCSNEEVGGANDRFADMWELMEMVRYTNLYDYSKYKWYSEHTFTVPYSKMKEAENIKKLDAELENNAIEWAKALEYVKEHGFRERMVGHRSQHDI